jgi:hypothetical protein
VSLRKEMLQVARLAKQELSEVEDLVTNFILSQHHSDGGFKNRAGESDIYYTVFALESLHAMMHEIPTESVSNYLKKFEEGRDLDLVHLCCLARSWSNLPKEHWADKNRLAILSQLEEFRTLDGGYCNTRGGSKGTVYHSFMAVAAYEDCHSISPEQNKVLDCLALLKTPDGAYANEVGMTMGTAPSSAAAESLLRTFQQPASFELSKWLLNTAHPRGGFLAMPEAPMPDLLSTATSLHALAGLKANLSEIKEPCLDYIDSLWNNRGGFHGNWVDEFVDVEYTYYGLLAIGHLSLL